jgi:membrane dipeptidase
MIEDGFAGMRSIAGQGAGFINIKNDVPPVEKEKTLKDSVKEKDYLEIHYDAILVDTHNDFIWKVFDKGAVFGQRNSFTQSDLPRFKEGGLDVQVFAIWISMGRISKSYSFVKSQIERLRNIESENSSELEFANTYDDIIRIINEKNICGLIGIEGGTVIEKNLDNINSLFGMGVRYIGLTWNNSNAISSSARDAVERGKQGGLTDFGIQVVKRMNEAGMLIDVSHLSEQGFWDVIENTDSPIIASHSNCYSINPHYRNLTDEQIKAIAKNGGYIGVNFYDKFLDKDGEKNGSTIEKVIEHIDYIKNLIGADYIGIGSDFDGGITPVRELYDASRYPELTRRLVERGYTEDEIKKILGGNFLRVFKQVCG